MMIGAGSSIDEEFAPTRASPPRPRRRRARAGRVDSAVPAAHARRRAVPSAPVPRRCLATCAAWRRTVGPPAPVSPAPGRTPIAADRAARFRLDADAQTHSRASGFTPRVAARRAIRYGRSARARCEIRRGRRRSRARSMFTPRIGSHRAAWSSPASPTPPRAGSRSAPDDAAGAAGGGSSGDGPGADADSAGRRVRAAAGAVRHSRLPPSQPLPPPMTPPIATPRVSRRRARGPRSWRASVERRRRARRSIRFSRTIRTRKPASRARARVRPDDVLSADDARKGCATGRSESCSAKRSRRATRSTSTRSERSSPNRRRISGRAERHSRRRPEDVLGPRRSVASRGTTIRRLRRYLPGVHAYTSRPPTCAGRLVSYPE